MNATGRADHVRLAYLIMVEHCATAHNVDQAGWVIYVAGFVRIWPNFWHPQGAEAEKCI